MERFKSIFEGLDVAYGQHQSERKRADGKHEGKSYIVKKLVTDELWTQHLNGEGPSLVLFLSWLITHPDGVVLILILIHLITKNLYKN